MKFAELKSTLRTNLSPVYLIHGADYYLANKAIELIKEAAHVNKDFDVSNLDDTASPQTITTECATVSFLGGKRVVIVKPFVQDLSIYLKSPNTNCVLILVSSEEKAVLKNVITVDCNPMHEELLIKLIANQLAKAGKKITPAAAALLCSYCQNFYSRIDGELNKLCNYFADTEVLGTDEVNHIVTKTQEYQIYELSNAICAGSIQRAEEILRALQDQGSDDYAIFASLVSSLRRIYYSLTCKSPNETIASVLGCSPYAVNYARRDYKNLAHKIAQLYDYALDLEYQIKSGRISVHNAIVLCFF